MQLLNLLAQGVTLSYEMFLLIVAIVIAIVLFYKNWVYKRGAYYQITRNSYFSILFNKGKYGEYLTYKYLKEMEASGAKFLFNVYIPKNGGTTEIDVLMISPKGIFVFESKNYGGWIFGNESQKSWCQTLPISWGKCRKEHFYNPIMQNQTHIEALKKLLGEQIPMYSIIVFSDRCTLKDVTVNSRDICVINRCKIASVVSSIYGQTWYDSLDKDSIFEIYNQLYPFSQVDEGTKVQHVANIHHNNWERYIQHSQSDEVKQSSTQQNRRCPWCNGKLILRSARKGKNIGRAFYGCSNYPQCRYIRNIEDDLNDTFFD